MTQRNTALFLERARVRVEGDRVVYDKAEGIEEKSFNIPFANLAILFLGQGTSLTQSAARLLSDEGVFLAFTSSGGSPLHYGSLTNYQVTKYLHDMYRVAESTEKSLVMAKNAIELRLDLITKTSPKIWQKHGINIDSVQVGKLIANFKGKLPQFNTHQNLMENEARLTKMLYRLYAESAGVSGFTRQHQQRSYKDQAAIINSRLDHGNYIAYGIAGSCLWSLGIPPSLSFFHGKTRSGGLVFDVADLFKDSIVMPLAFARHKTDVEFRAKLLDSLEDHNALKTCFDFMKSNIME